MGRNWLIVLGLLGTGWGVAAQDTPEVTFVQREIVSGLSHPWELALGPDGWLWVTERTGRRVVRVNPATGVLEVALEIPDVFQEAPQDGVLGLALHPRLGRGEGTDFVYVAYTYDGDAGPARRRRLRVRRYTETGGRLGNPVDVLDELPAHDDHVAGRLAFGPDDRLYLSIGDQGSNWSQNYCNPNLAQSLPTVTEVATRDWTHYQGKILRLNLDGSIPPDNPVIGGVRSHVYSYGHRNPQGLAFAPDGTLYASEHGPSTDDELNRIESGRNYGWPRVAGYQDGQAYVFANWAAASPTACADLPFSATEIPPDVPQLPEGEWSDPAFTPPLATFFTVPADYDVQASGPATIAPSSAEVYATADGGIPGWAPSVLVPSLVEGTVYRVKLAADGRSAVGEPTRELKSTNRYRDVAIAPGGRTIYVLTDNDGRTTDGAGNATRTVENPGAILAFDVRP